LRSTIESGLAIADARYTEALDLRASLVEATRDAIADFDAVLMPAVPEPAPVGLESTGDPRLLLPWTLLGFPAIALPSGWAVSGLPLSVQLAATPANEARLLDAARRCEQLLSFSRARRS
jgi:Asp-tRNA(Asn)/Glu-tRNA(Gln) amidotransferase A subunit family amidase